MFGIIGSALMLGVVTVFFIKRKKMKSIDGKPITFVPKEKSVVRYLIGGIIFGLGWALVGSCPGPMYTLIGAGAFTIFIAVAGAILGTFVYGAIRKHLPH